MLVLCCMTPCSWLTSVSLTPSTVTSWERALGGTLWRWLGLCVTPELPLLLGQGKLWNRWVLGEPVHELWFGLIFKTPFWVWERQIFREVLWLWLYMYLDSEVMSLLLPCILHFLFLSSLYLSHTSDWSALGTGHWRYLVYPASVIPRELCHQNKQPEEVEGYHLVPRCHSQCDGERSLHKSPVPWSSKCWAAGVLRQIWKFHFLWGLCIYSMRWLF